MYKLTLLIASKCFLRLHSNPALICLILRIIHPIPEGKWGGGWGGGVLEREIEQEICKM